MAAGNNSTAGNLPPAVELGRHQRHGQLCGPVADTAGLGWLSRQQRVQVTWVGTPVQHPWQGRARDVHHERDAGRTQHDREARQDAAYAAEEQAWDAWTAARDAVRADPASLSLVAAADQIEALYIGI